MIDVLPARDWALVVHGGASGVLKEERHDEVIAGIEKAFRAGEAVLEVGGSALEAVCAAVCVLEDEPVFNAGRGAALTAAGTAEHDACVMTDDATAGAVAASKYARNPVLAARAVKEQTKHVLIVDPPAELIEEWGVETAPRDYFVTELRAAQLRARQAAQTEGPRHGTVGAVARDADGHLAAATSTGGIENQAVGRVGDSPIVGAGTYANEFVAVSCTGEGEAFLQGVVAHDVAARMRYLGATVAEAAEATINAEVTGRNALGALIAVDADGRLVVAQNTPMMVTAWRDGDRIVSRL